MKNEKTMREIYQKLLISVIIGIIGILNILMSFDTGSVIRRNVGILMVVFFFIIYPLYLMFKKHFNDASYTISEVKG